MSNPEKQNLEERLLAHLTRPEYRAVKPKVIAKQLELAEDQKRDLKRALKRLAKAGKIAWGDKHLVLPLIGQSTSSPSKSTQASTKPPAPSFPESSKKRSSRSDAPEPSSSESSPEAKQTVPIKSKYAGSAGYVTGVFRRAPSGNGYVRPANLPAGSDRSLNIFVPSDATSDASSGDTVVVKIRKRNRPGRDSMAGEIVEILERDTHRFVGTYFIAEDIAYVKIDGKTFAEPIPVGDPGAKNAQDDDKVLIEMVRFPSSYQKGEGVIVEVLGKRGEPGVDTMSIIHEYNLPQEFSEDVLNNARAEADKFNERIEAPRRDLTKMTIITIDPVDARDFDDAISLTRDERGYWQLGVHIADVSHFVKPKTALDKEAYERATSCYLPDRVIPMLPEIISNNLASLQPHKVRYTMSCFIEYSPEGVVTHVEPAMGAIQSARRFTYEEVDEYLADREAWKEKLDVPVHKLLADMHELAMMLRQRRMKKGSLELSMQEVKIDLDKDGKVSGAHVAKNTESHQMIEEFMLAANVAIAELLFGKGIHFLRRIHANPDPRKLKLLTEFVNELGIETESLESRFELQRVLAAVHEKPEQQAVNYAMLRSFQRAIYGPEEAGHYALAFDTYCHFTSPIRRYPDLTVHRLITALIEGKKPVSEFDQLMLAGEHCSDRERRAEAAERELIKMKLLTYMNERVGTEMDAVITGVEEFGLFAQGLEIPAEGMIHITALADDHYQFDRASHSLTGRRAGNTFRLGDKIRVVVARADIDRRELDFRLAGKIESAKPLHVRVKSDRSNSTRRGSKQSGAKPARNGFRDNPPSKGGKGTDKSKGKKKKRR